MKNKINTGFKDNSNLEEIFTKEVLKVMRNIV